MKNPKVSIITLTMNRKTLLRRALNSLRNQSFKDYEIIVIDNNSTDGTPDMIRKEFPEVRLLEMESNIGIDGRNKGVKLAKGDIIFSLDDDGYLEENAMKKAVEHLEEDPKIGMACFKSLDPETKKISNWTYSMPKEKYKNKEFYVTYFCATAQALKKEVLNKMPYFFNKEFFVYGEEFDTAYKILDLGYDLKYFPDVIMYHKIMSKTNPKKYYLERRNMLWNYWINFPFFYALKRTITLIIKGFLSIPKGLWKTHLKYLLDAFLGLPKIIIKYRKPIKKETIKKITKINKFGYY